jgi:hypothetical protein
MVRYVKKIGMVIKMKIYYEFFAAPLVEES